jgi:hypothetical protein
MGKIIDITGRKYGRLTVKSYVGNYEWLCECECGGEKIVKKHSLTSEFTKSCGCLARENRKLTNIKRGEKQRIKIDILIGELIGKTHGNVMYLEEDVEMREKYLKKGKSFYFISCKCLICGKIFHMRTGDVREHHKGCQICTRRNVGYNSVRWGNIWCLDGNIAYTKLDKGIIYIDSEDLDKVQDRIVVRISIDFSGGRRTT